ncbi:cytochrome c biogenesis protein CcsA, partial [Candidatus Sumerlaeota bacterium]|nr:cytochrome c biogenesis protein CcsA [Candidatus Sumerlaeota bacterium]
MNSGSARHCRLAIAYVACGVLAFLLGASAWSATAELPGEALEQVVVQDYGFEKTLLTFARERLGLFGRGAALPDEHPIVSVLGMILRQNEWRKRPLFKIHHPALIAMFGHRKLICADDFLNDSALQQLRHLVQTQPNAEPAVSDLDRRVHALLDVKSGLAIVPRAGEEWLSPYEVRKEQAATGAVQGAIVAAYADVCRAFLEDDPKEFAKTAENLARLNRTAAEQAGAHPFRLRVDRINTQLQPFSQSAVLYLLATMVYVAALLAGRRAIATAGFALMVAGFAAHAAGLIFRTVLVGRAPMANMYESLVVAVAGTVLLAIVLDRIYKNPLIGLAGVLLGFVFMVIAVKMPLHQSRIAPLRPALQSSWLTYHVTTVMLSYSAFALSFLVSVVYLLRRAAAGNGGRARLLKAL